MSRKAGLRKAGIVVTTILVFAAGLSLSLVAAQAASPASTLGVYRGAANPSGVSAFSQWLGSPVSYAEDFLPGDSWSTIESPSWWLNAWKGTSYRMVYGVPVIPGTGGSLAEGATGAYNAHFKKLAENLVAAGQGNAILRLGWEFGGGWYLWHVSNATDAANYAAYWRQIVTTMRAAAPNLAFDWNPVWGWQSVDPTAAYPGDAYVNYVGIDVYDQSWISNYTDAAARWNDALTAPWGLTWQRDFAAAHGKPMSFPEWGVATRSDGHGGGDAPYFIQKMTQWIAQNNVGYQVYFAFDAPDGAHNLMNGSFPNSAAALKTALSSSATTTTTTTTQTTTGSTGTTTTTGATTTTTTSAPPTTTTTSAPPPTTTTPKTTTTRRHKIWRNMLGCVVSRGSTGHKLSKVCRASYKLAASAKLKKKLAKRAAMKACLAKASRGLKSSTASKKKSQAVRRCTKKYKTHVA